MPEVAVATVSRDAAEAGARMADEGGNAVDAALAAALTAVATHPGMCSFGGSGFVTVWPAAGPPVTVDGAHEMPGRDLPPERFGNGLVEVHLEYGGGVDTTVGPGSVATPGLLAALSLAADRYGTLPWRELVEPAYERAVRGFPMPPSCHAFLAHAHEAIYGRDPRSRAALHRDGRLLEPGETIQVEGLADTLRHIADEGAETMYGGELGRRVAEHVEEGGGVVTLRDLEEYRPVVREPLFASLDGWRAATNPPPAAGGAAVAAMLARMGEGPGEEWTASDVERLVEVQSTVLRALRRRMEAGEALEPTVRRLAERREAGAGDDPGARPGRGPDAAPSSSGATIQISAVDGDGTACAVTVSDGYGSGIMPPGTGIWLNNCLGEKELNPRGYHALAPGTRLPSNMAPTVAQGPDGRRLALGSPGAERIPTAVLHVLLNFVRAGMPLREAIEAPRLHVERIGSRPRVAFEPGLPVGDVRLPVRKFAGPHMFFGGVEAALWTPGGAFETWADSRRTGGTAVGGKRRSR